MNKSAAFTAILISTTVLLAGCASDNGLFPSSFTTQAIDNTPNKSIPVATAPSVPPANPICTTLAAQIEALRADGVVERAEKVSTGKTKTVAVKRTSLGMLTKLDKLNREYQASCSVPLPKPLTAQAPVTTTPGSSGVPANTATVVPVTTPPATPR